MSRLAEKLSARFIVLDGPDGSGKSTQLRLLAEFLRAAGAEVRTVRDPGGTAIGDKVRAMLLDKAHQEMALPCEMLLYMASRAQLAAEVIRPALASGNCVLCDRYVSATVAYQGAAGAKADDILAAGRLAVGDLWPDLTVLLDLPVETGLHRIEHLPDRIESRDLAFHRRVRDLFLRQASDSPDKFAVIDASGDIEQVHRRLCEAIENRFP